MIHHENLFGKEYDKIQEWRSALSKAGDLTGQHIHIGSEAKHIEEIVEKVCARIAPKPLHVDDDLVGLEHHVEKVKSLLGLKDNNRCMLGIYGPGRVGKSELAKVLYNEIAHEFDGASFLSNVGVNSKKKGIEYLQKTLLSEMYEPLRTELGSTCKGISEMKKRLQHKKVLLVLDGVDSIEQLNELAGKGDWFGFGSRIIITTRDKSLVGCHQFDKFSYYKMSELNEQHSLELFSQMAFKNSHPKIGYEDVSARAVSHAKGLPLAIKAMASSLSTKKSVKAWQYAMDDYERIPDNIQDVLRVNNVAFEHYAETAFIDIGCLFTEERKECKNNNIRTNRVTAGSECIDFYNFFDYSYHKNAEKDTKTTDWMMEELLLPPHNGTHPVRQVIECVHHWSQTARTTERSTFDCRFCKRGYMNFHTLKGHMNSHKRARAKAKKAKAKAEEVINIPYNSLEEEEEVLPESEPEPEPEHIISIWSKYGLNTCKFLFIFRNGEVLDFQRLDNVDIIL